MPPLQSANPPSPVAAALAQCNGYLKKKDYHNAWLVLGNVLEHMPGNVEIRCQRAQLALLDQNLDGAFQDYSEVVRIAPQHAAARTGLARTLLLRGDLAGANREAGHALSLNPQDTDAQSIRREINSRRPTGANENGPNISPTTVSLQDILGKNRPFKNIHAGKRCFIIGNGPSTNHQNLHLLSDQITIAVNDFSRNPAAKEIKSNYWVLADPLYWEQPETYFKPVAQLAQQLALSPRLFAPTGAFQLLNSQRPGPLIECNYFHFGNAGIDQDIDFGREIPTYGQNVIIVALMLAFHLGCNPIYLIGVDHDVLKVREEDYAHYVSRHSYKSPDPKHGKLSELMSWTDWLAARDRMVFQYSQLKKYADGRGIRVYDATLSGHLEVFPKVDYAALFHADSVDASVSKALLAPHLYADAALRLLDTGDAYAALALLDKAHEEIPRSKERILGIHYLRAIALAKLSRFSDALLAVRQDLAENPNNRTLAEQLHAELQIALNQHTP